ncbi:LysR family transcriptional regulator [Corallococcus aberystwythensis]|uniref:LysR family transcriptional regulator n=1 Tax=Corallococcus aberystwythensis TaxID=2316722 RepID=A0A3A8QCI7_9BACT|nr:LysR family transcriptional regulator [Corallococcus aberystwythensis]RKH66449.1 LysR family transcriptional regulator [Corallococcus aberystwythensis]
MQLDLNLLLALDALLEEGSVGGAARRMHVTSPAMSRTLGRIRDLTGDAIFVRTGRDMTPTPYALAVREEVHAIVLRAQAVLAQRDALDLSRLERVFTLQCHDAIASAIGAPLLARMRKEAPRVTLRLLAESAADTNDLRQGNVDLELGAATPSHRDVNHQVVSQDRLVVALRARHPLAGRKLTVRAYAGAEHVTVSRRGRLRDPVDEALAAQGLSRRVAAAVPTSAAALRFASETDLLVAVPEKMCAAALKALHLKTLPMPVTVPSLSIVAAWHRRHEPDRAHGWLRQQVQAVLTELTAAGPR